MNLHPTTPRALREHAVNVSRARCPPFRPQFRRALLCAVLATFTAGTPGRGAEPERKIVAAVPENWPPEYSLNRQGRPEGFAVEILDAVASRAGLKVSYRVEKTFPEALAALDRGEVDVIPNMGITPERLARFAFTTPVETFSVSLWVRTDTRDVWDLQSLRGRRVAVVESNVAIGLLESRARHGFDLASFPDVHQALFALLSGQVDALAYPSPVIRALAEKAGLERRIQEVGEPLAEIKRAMAVRRGDPELRERLDRAVRELEQTPEFQDIYVRWYGEARRGNMTWVAWALGLLLAGGLLAFALWRYRVVRELRETTARLQVAASERRKVQAELRDRTEELLQAQKMEAVGRLAGGVAHDFNNLLTAITGYSELLLTELDPEDPRREYADHVRRAGESAAALTRQLLAFSRRQVFQTRLVDLTELVTRSEGMLRRVIEEHIEVVTELEAAPGPVLADPVQLEQVLLNLVVNACDAMPEGGTLTVRTWSTRLDAEGGRGPAGATAGPHVVLEVCDTGTGMAPETLSQVFEPFFTTKESGRGTGLGLSTVYGIVQQTGGAISVDSEPGRGTSIQVYLPRAAGELEPVREAPPLRPEAATGLGATILVVEDDPDLRELEHRVLRQAGFTVLEADGGPAALELVGRRDGRAVDLLVTDMVMPKMGGEELAQQLRERLPGLKVLFTSGYASRALSFEELHTSEGGFLQKPFSPDRLIRAVRRLLGAGD